MKDHFEGDEFKIGDGDDTVDKQKIIEYVEHMTEETKYGYRFIYKDTYKQVSTWTQLEATWHIGTDNPFHRNWVFGTPSF